MLIISFQEVVDEGFIGSGDNENVDKFVGVCDENEESTV